jgi:hypothetical protein
VISRGSISFCAIGNGPEAIFGISYLQKRDFFDGKGRGVEGMGEMKRMRYGDKGGGLAVR